MLLLRVSSIFSGHAMVSCAPAELLRHSTFHRIAVARSEYGFLWVSLKRQGCCMILSMNQEAATERRDNSFYSSTSIGAPRALHTSPSTKGSWAPFHCSSLRVGFAGSTFSQRPDFSSWSSVCQWPLIFRASRSGSGEDSKIVSPACAVA